jgi:hypothetical protein
MGEVLQVAFTNGIIAALVIAALLTLLFQPYLRRALFSNQETITIRQRVVGSVFLAVFFVLLVLVSFAVALGVLHLAWSR